MLTRAIILLGASACAAFQPSGRLHAPRGVACRSAAPQCIDVASLAESAAANPNALALVGAAAVGAAYSVLPRGPIGAPYAADARAYDPVAADAFYLSRLPVVISRLLRLAFLTTGFNLRLLVDWQLYKRKGSPEDESWPNEKDRAKEASPRPATHKCCGPGAFVAAERCAFKIFAGFESL